MAKPFTTSPPIPLISTQSPGRMPFGPIKTNHPKKPTMKSLSATVSPAPARARTVANWQGGNPRSSFDESKLILLLASLHQRVPLPVESVELSQVGGPLIEFCKMLSL